MTEKFTAREKLLFSLDREGVRLHVKGAENIHIGATLRIDDVERFVAHFDLSCGAHITNVSFKRIDVAMADELVTLTIDLY